MGRYLESGRSHEDCINYENIEFTSRSKSARSSLVSWRISVKYAPRRVFALVGSGQDCRFRGIKLSKEGEALQVVVRRGSVVKRDPGEAMNAPALSPLADHRAPSAPGRRMIPAQNIVASSGEIIASSSDPSGNRTRHSNPTEPFAPRGLASSRTTGTSKRPASDTRVPICAASGCSAIQLTVQVVEQAADEIERVIVFGE